MKRKYCRLTEVDSSDQLGIDLRVLCSYIQESLLHPIIYIDSLLAHACEMQKNNKLLAVGHCSLTAYWDAGDRIIDMVNTFMRGASIQMESAVWKSQFIEAPLIRNWQTELHLFNRVPPEDLSPKIFSEDLKIECFVVLEKLTINNVLLLESDVIKLKDCSKGKGKVSNKINKVKKMNILEEVLKEMY